MKRLLFFLLILLLPAFAAHHNPPVYYHLPADTTVTTLPEEGRMTTFLQRGTGDTLRAWVEHASKWDRPDYQSANKADIVIWCHPDRWPHENHVLPNAKGVIVAIASNRGIEGQPRLVVFTEKNSPTAAFLRDNWGVE